MPHSGGVQARCLWLAALATILLSPERASGQAVTPLPQDELDFQGRASLAVGSGARALGMGGAFLARADDATAASWNPAGLSYLRLPEISLVGVRNDSETLTKRSTGATAEDSEARGYQPDFIAAAIPLEIGTVSGAAQISFQRVLSLDAQRTTRRANVQIQQAFEGGFDVLAFGTGVKVTRSLRLGLTLNRWLNGYRQTRVRVPVVFATTQDIDFQLSGWNLNFGALWSPNESFNLGAVVKTPFEASVRLERRRQDVVGGQQQSNSFVSESVRLELPAAVGIGASWRPSSPFTISADHTRTFWSNGRIRNFFTLPLLGDPNRQGQVFDSLNYPAVDEVSQEDTEQFRLGAEYVLLGRHVRWPLRAGFFTDRQYFRGGNGRPPVFIGFALGAGILVGPVLIDAAFVHESGDYLDREGNEIDVRIRRLYLSLIYRHRGRP